MMPKLELSFSNNMESEPAPASTENSEFSHIPTDGSLYPPSETIYIRNLSEKVKIGVLKKSLEAVFSSYGTILDIVAHKNIRMKGQAFVVFDSISSAQKAIADVQSFKLFDKPMVLQFSKTKSDATIKKYGTEEEFEQHKKQRLERKESLKVIQVKAPKTSATKKNISKKATQKPPTIPDEYLPPHKILFLQKLPENVTADVLSAVFGRFPGFKEVRMVPGRAGIAFVEYERDEDAIIAKQGTVGMSLGIMKTKLKGAIIGHSLLKKKSEALSKRFRTVIGLINELKREMVQAMQSAMFSLAEMNYVMGDDVKHQILENTQTSCFRLKTGYENISGVYLPIYECSLRDISDHRLIGLGKGSQKVQKCREMYTKAIDVLTAFIILDDVIKITNRRVNAVEYVVIPKVENTIKYINSELEELEREDFTRLKKVQVKKKIDIEKENKGKEQMQKAAVVNVLESGEDTDIIF
ncbi:hypothetical protein MERGE_000765 [Pneumocystis wakefieldiae]|uniref:RRM domain-containing protein n=1 Tax=Pneumocystis wakefieldiae TaxID=38082 RepID=A0A899G0M4_9ASCO|nr:hypothetical protein MERGE_000765 [Pneumocystis wakefieldiae]